MKKSGLLDELDLRILMELQKDCRKSLQEIANSVDAHLSTVYYRVKRLEKKKIISGYSATINPDKLGLDYSTIISVWTSFEPDNYQKIGNAISEIPGVWAVYNCLGEVNFFVLTRARDKREFLKILDDMMKIEGIIKINTHVAIRIVKEDPRLNIKISQPQKLKKWPLAEQIDK